MSSGQDHHITRILDAISAGDVHAIDRLLPLVYDEMKGIARSHVAKESAGNSLQPTALVHEAYLKLLGNGPTAWENRRHFFAAAAESMRRILVDQARMHRRKKRGGGWRRVPLESALSWDDPETHSEQILALDIALLALKDHDQRMYDIVMLRHYAGLTNEQVAKAIEVSPRTAQRHWSVARLWLSRFITDHADTEAESH